MEPRQIISLMKFEGATNTFSMGDHDDHIHVGFQPLYGTNSKMAKQVNAVLKPKQWIKLIDRLNEIDNPKVTARRPRTRSRSRAGARPSHTGRVGLAALTRFRFAQLEFPGRLGPDAGRYVRAALRGRRRAAGARHRRAGGGAAASAAGGRACAAPTPEPAAGRGHARDGDRAAPLGSSRRPTRGWRGRPATTPDATDAALGRSSTARVAGHRVAERRPGVADADPARAIGFRLGYGTRRAGRRGPLGGGARAAPAGARRAPRSALLRPQERVAALLGGRDAPLACEELALRARGDLNTGARARRRSAARGPGGRRWRSSSAPRRRRSGHGASGSIELRGRRGAIGAAANAAAPGPRWRPGRARRRRARRWRGSRRRCGRALGRGSAR